ncbi:MAG: hypothetical protein ACREC5_08440, partial [Thermoplasmata archaeon]
MLIRGAILDSEGARRGYVRIRDGRITEVGALGAESSRGRERVVHGIVLPHPVNAHTHLGDAAFRREPPPGPVSRIVAPPRGIKFRVLSETTPEDKVEAMRQALRRMSLEGVGAVV